MEQEQPTLEQVVALARELTVLEKVRLLEEVVADLESSLGDIENAARGEARPD